MSRPLFSVGEEVILQSKTHPQFNGEYVVEEIVVRGEYTRCRHSGMLGTVSSEQYGYLLDELLLAFNDSGQVAEGIVLQSELKKRPKPSDDSFEELMNKLKRPEKRLEKV